MFTEINKQMHTFHKNKTKKREQMLFSVLWKIRNCDYKLFVHLIIVKILL